MLTVPWLVTEHLWINTVNPFPNNKFWTLLNSKNFADNNFNFDLNGRTFSKRFENIVGKGEIAH